MNTRKSDHQYRKDHILGIVVNEYIRSVTPVSSGLIAHEHHVDLSSATIRNILAELEAEGLLTHPHTSAGRVPTQEGYRYYVDYLMNEIQLLEDEKARIKQEYVRKANDLEAVLDKASEVISDLTQYTSIVAIDGWRNKYLCRGTCFVVEYPDLPDINKVREILTALEEKERLLEIINRDLERKIKVYIGHEMALRNIQDCSLAVSGFRTEQGVCGRLAVLGPTHMNYQRVVSMLDYVSRLLGEVLS